MVGKNLLLSLFTFCAICILVTKCHVKLEEKKTVEQSSANDMKRLQELLPPILIVELTKTSRRISRADAEKKKLSKKKNPPRKTPKPPPPANCVPLLGNCKPPAPPCCNPCAICQCRLFQTVCFYRMGYPNC